MEATSVEAWSPVDFFDTVVAHETALWGRVDAAVVRACGVRLGSLSALRVIASRGDRCRVQDLTVDLQITVGAASKIVDRLEGAGLAQRRPHVSDRRSSVITATEAGRNTVAEGLAAMEVALGEHLQGTDAAQLTAMTGQLTQLTRSARCRDGGVAVAAHLPGDLAIGAVTARVSA